MLRKFITKLTTVLFTLAILQITAPAITRVVPQDLLPVFGVAEAACGIPFIFQNFVPGGPSQPIRADQLNANFNAVTGCFNAAGLPQVANVTALQNASTALFPNGVIRTGYAAAGDVPALVYTVQSAPCSLNGGNGDGGSQVKSLDNKCWIAQTTDAREFGIQPATYLAFPAVTTTAGNSAVTISGASFTNADVNKWITILGAGPYEGRYIGQITGVSNASQITVSPAPTLSMTAYAQTMNVYYGADASTGINAAFAAANRFKSGSVLPAGIYMVNAPLQCTMIFYNNADLPQPNCVGALGGGTTLMATNNMMASSPSPGSLLTVGGYANNQDFSQYIRNADFNGNGITLDCNFICKDSLNIPFSQVMFVHGFQAKNALQAGFHFGNTAAPQPSAAMEFQGNSYTRDIFDIPIASITNTTQPVVTTTIDHGVTTGRIVTIAGSSNLAQPGPITFLATALSPRSLLLHNINGSGWAGFTCPNVPTTPPCASNNTSAFLTLTMPSNVILHPVFSVSNGAVAAIQIDGDINIANGQTWCMYGIGGTTTPFQIQEPAPDGCYTISSVSGAGGDGPFNFQIPFNSTGFTFTGGGIAFQQPPLADMGVYEDNISDFDATLNAILGTRYGFYANPATSGYDGKYTSNHINNFPESGWLIAAHFLGGHNTMTGEECDVPMLFCGQFVSYGNASHGSELQGSGFLWIRDTATWMWRLELCGGCTTFNGVADLTSTGDHLFGQSNTIRVNEISNHAFAGNAAWTQSMPNYHVFGNSSFDTTYVVSDSDGGLAHATLSPSNPTGTTNTTGVAMGLGSTCQITPLYRTSVTFTINGTMSNTVAADGVFGAIFVGTGAPPANGAAFGGGVAQLGAQSGITTFPANSASLQFSWTGTLNNMTPGTTYWFDALARAVGGGTGSIANLTCTATEHG